MSTMSFRLAITAGWAAFAAPSSAGSGGAAPVAEAATTKSIATAIPAIDGREQVKTGIWVLRCDGPANRSHATVTRTANAAPICRPALAARRAISAGVLRRDEIGVDHGRARDRRPRRHAGDVTG